MPELTIEEFQAYLNDSNKENAHGTERGTILVGCAIMEDLLKRILAEFLIDDAALVKDLFRDGSSFGSFAMRIDACRALGLIDRVEAETLHKMRKIRNDFAHKIGVTLQEESLHTRCVALRESTLFTEVERSNRNVTKGDPRLAFGDAAGRMAIILKDRLSDTVSQKRMELVDPLELAERGYRRNTTVLPT